MDTVHHLKIYSETGYYAGWPANAGLWRWDNELLVGFAVARHRETRGGHAYDARNAHQMFARSLDGGLTWTLEDAYAAGITAAAKDHSVGARSIDPGPCPGDLDFTHPDFAMLFHRTDDAAGASHFYLTQDRGYIWRGPFAFPNLGQPGILARTDYLVEGPKRLLAMLTASKSNGREGRVGCARTEDGGRSWRWVGWVDDEPAGYAIMPATVRLADGCLMTVVRRRDGDRCWLAGYVSDDDGASWRRSVDPAPDTGLNGNPPALIRLADGRLCLAYAERSQGPVSPSRILIHFGSADGRRWDAARILRDRDGADWDVGYPRIAQRPDGTVIVVYYYNHAWNETPSPRYIAASLFNPDRGLSAESFPTISWRRRVPLRYEADVAVIGGGMAGVCAAAAAARSGARVVLVERFGVPGGVLTSGGVANFCDERVIRNPLGEVFADILAGLDAWRAIGDGRPSCFHYQILALVLQELLLRRGVKLLLHTRCVDVRVRAGRITEIMVCGASGPEALRAAQVIDTSGESGVARAAGFQTLDDRYAGRWRLPMSMMYFVRHVDETDAGPLLPEGWFAPIRDADALPMTSIWPDGPGGNAVKIKVPLFDASDTEGLTAAEIQARRRMLAVHDYHCRVAGKPWRFDHCSPIIGIREGARIAGDYVLTVDDLRAGRAFDDAVARGSYNLDGHKPDDDKRTYILPRDQLAVPPYHIPLRSLIARDGRNLWMAGRNLSADQLALSSARVATSCAMMGQAVGLAAAMAAKKGADPRALDPRAVRQGLEQRGADLTL